MPSVRARPAQGIRYSSRVPANCRNIHYVLTEIATGHLSSKARFKQLDKNGYVTGADSRSTDFFAGANTIRANQIAKLHYPVSLSRQLAPPTRPVRILFNRLILLTAHQEGPPPPPPGPPPPPPPRRPPPPAPPPANTPCVVRRRCDPVSVTGEARFSTTTSAPRIICSATDSNSV